MVYAVCPGDRFVIARVHAFDRADIHTILARIRAALMMGIYPAGLAEKVLRRAGAKGVKRHIINALQDLKVADHDRDVGCLTAAAERTVAADGL